MLRGRIGRFDIILSLHYFAWRIALYISCPADYDLIVCLEIGIFSVDFV